MPVVLDAVRPMALARQTRIARCAGRFLFALWMALCSGCRDQATETNGIGRNAETPPSTPDSGQREEVIFWHFWGGEDGEVVDEIVRRFNESQDEYVVRSIAMPGNNLQAKLFLSVTGGDPPDIVNQDDPILADWSARGILRPLERMATADELAALDEHLFPAAQRLSQVDGRYWGLCNGLDIRALYINRTALRQRGLALPATLDDLDRIATTLSPGGPHSSREFYAYLPDSRRLWAWGYVFGGQFYDPQSDRATIDHPAIIRAAEWMANYSAWYGADNIAAFRQGDQSLPGKTFPLLPTRSDGAIGRYAIVMDGQWRVRDIRRFQAARRTTGGPPVEFSVVPLPPPTGGRSRAGWVNGNFFVFPAHSKCPQGAWEFAKYWVGFTDTHQAAVTCEQGGWIPVNRRVAQSDEFQRFLDTEPMFRTFVDLASSPHQFPIPQIPGAMQMKRMVERAGYDIMYDPETSPSTVLRETNDRFQAHLERRRRRLEHE